MFKLQIKPLPSQVVTASLGGNRYSITLKDAAGFMVSSISRNGEQLTDGVRIVYGTPLLNYKYLEDGDFILFMQDSGDSADYKNFGSSQFLYFVEQAEIDALR